MDAITVKKDENASWLCRCGNLEFVDQSKEFPHVAVCRICGTKIKIQCQS